MISRTRSISYESLCAVLSFRNVLQVGDYWCFFNLSFLVHVWLVLVDPCLLLNFYSNAPCKQATFISIMMTLNLWAVSYSALGRKTPWCYHQWTGTLRKVSMARLSVLSSNLLCIFMTEKQIKAYAEKKISCAGLYITFISCCNSVRRFVTVWNLMLKYFSF